MAVQVDQSGYFEVVYGAPWKGLNTMQPENLMDGAHVPAVSDFTFRNDELRSRPSFNPTLVAIPAVASIGQLVGLMPNPAGTLQLAIVQSGTNAAAYQISQTDFLTWTAIPASVGLGPTFNPSFPVAWRIFGGKVYFTQQGSQQVNSWDGGTIQIAVASQGGNNLGAAYIDELDNHVVLANVMAGSTAFPNRVWWSATGLPTVWDPAVNINAGFADFLEVPDQITGMMMLGRVGYIFRTNGITEMDPTGNGQAPFSFNHLWASQYGIGNVLSMSISQYGTTGVFISSEQVYAVSSYELNPIGGMARDAIMADVSLPRPPVVSTVRPSSFISAMVPYVMSGVGPFASAVGNSNSGNIAQFGGVYPFFAYMLILIQATGTKFWVYDFGAQNWTTWFIPGYWVTTRPILANVGTVGVGVQNTKIIFTMVNIQTGNAFLGAFDTTSFDDPQQGSTITFKTEDIVPFRVPTVRRVLLVYRDLGPATLTVSITTTNDNGVVQTVSVPGVTIGNTVATGKLLTKFVDLQATGFRPTLSLTRAPGGGPVSLSIVAFNGVIEKGTL